jgi:hypothetical protein
MSFEQFQAAGATAQGEIDDGDVWLFFFQENHGITVVVRLTAHR